MNMCCVLVILAQCGAAFTHNVWVNRRGTSDTFTPLTECADECKKRNGRCSKSDDQCCERCTCENGKTFFEESGTQSCVKNAGHSENCLYHFQGSENPDQKTFDENKLTRNRQVRIGYITTTKTRSAKLSNCSLLGDFSKYWDVFNGWQPLFQNHRRIDNFEFGKRTRRGILSTTLNLRTTNNAERSSYNGLLLKLELQCTSEETSGRMIKRKSCLVFKIKGLKQYEMPATPATTTKSSTVSVTKTMTVSATGPMTVSATKPPNESTTKSLTDSAIKTSTDLNTISPVVLRPTVAHSKSKQNAIAIALVVLLFVLCALIAIAILLWRRRKRKYGKAVVSFKRNSKDYTSNKNLMKININDNGIIDDVPECKTTSNGKPVKDLSNPIYLQTAKQPLVLKVSTESEYDVPELVINRGKGKKKKQKSFEYDYPEIEVTPMTKKEKAKLGFKSKHDYVSVSIDSDPLNHSYTYPSKWLGSRKPPLSSQQGYASLDENTSNEDYQCIIDNSRKRPSIPKYASLDISDGNKTDGAKLEPGNQGYAKLDKTTLEADTGTNYFELENESEGESKDIEQVNVDENEPT